MAGQAAGKVYVSDGANSGAWTAHSTFSGAFGNALLHVREQQTANVNSSNAFTANTWSTATVNTVVTNEISGSSLSSNNITLPAGTYFCMFKVPTMSTVSFAGKPRLRNTTAGTTLVVGSSFFQNQSTSDSQWMILHGSGKFTLGASSTLNVQMWMTANEGTYTAVAGGHGEVEVYAEAYFWKVA